ncbi:MAG: hypothetical protein O3A46_07260 [Candidatus Poribacteria bacterium]|nr:hypothetical protein [Candidatus Poribacteria bacterium]
MRSVQGVVFPKSVEPEFHQGAERLDVRYPEALAPSVDQGVYVREAQEHLDRLLAIGLSQTDGWDGASDAVFDVKRYESLERMALEQGPAHLTPQSNRDNASEAAEKSAIRFDEWVESVVGSGKEFQPYLRFMRRAVKNGVFFDRLYGDDGAPENPWQPIVEVLSRGVLLSPDGDTKRKHLIMRSRGGKTTGRCQLGKRYETIQLVYAHMKAVAPGYESAVSGDSLVEHLSANKKWAKDYRPFLKREVLQVEVIAPLKRAGLVGSSNEGYFVLTCEEDCDKSIEFHYSKVHSMALMVEAARAKKNAIRNGATRR